MCSLPEEGGDHAGDFFLSDRGNSAPPRFDAAEVVDVDRGGISLDVPTQERLEFSGSGGHQDCRKRDRRYADRWTVGV